MTEPDDWLRVDVLTDGTVREAWHLPLSVVRRDLDKSPVDNVFLDLPNLKVRRNSVHTMALVIYVRDG